MMPDPFDELVSLGDDASPDAQQPNLQPSTVTFPRGSVQSFDQSQPQPGQSATAQALRDDGTI
jgi:hypothetical protein